MNLKKEKRKHVEKSSRELRICFCNSLEDIKIVFVEVIFNKMCALTKNTRGHFSSFQLEKRSLNSSHHHGMGNIIHIFLFNKYVNLDMLK